LKEINLLLNVNIHIYIYLLRRRFLIIDDVKEYEQNAMEKYAALISYGTDQYYVGNRRYHKNIQSKHFSHFA